MSDAPPPRRRRSLPAALLALGALGACAPAGTTVLPGEDGRVSVQLVNPTTCASCDAFAGVDTLRVDLYVDDALISTTAFAWPDEPAVIPALDGFGVVRIEVVGLSAGRVVSGGRTPPIALDPGQPVSVPMLFAPVNVALPLDASPSAHRSRQVALRRRDGNIALLGGLDVEAGVPLDSVDVFSAASYAFGTDQAVLSAPAYDVRVLPLPDGGVLFGGGERVDAGVPSAIATTGLWLPDSSAYAPGGDLSTPRAGHCLAAIDDVTAVAFGGTTANTGDIGRSGGPTTGWTWSSFTATDFAAASTLGCIGLDGGGVFVLGSDVGSTGIWSWSDAATTDPSASFHAINPYTAGDVRIVAGAVMARLTDGSVWIAGGVDPTSGALTGDGRRFASAAQSFTLAAGLQVPRYAAGASPWYRDDWYVVGCGWQDSDRLRPEPTLELVNALTADVGPVIDLDRTRDGCTATSMVDGSVLVAGGYTLGGVDQTDAALVIPWLDEVPTMDTGT